MDLQPPKSESPAATPALKRHSKLRLLLMAAGALLLAILLILVISTPPDPTVAWLSPAQLNQSIGPKPLPKIRQLARAWAGPVIRWFRGNPPNVQISYNAYALPASAVDPVVLGPPVATNAAGLRAWIPSKTELAKFRLALETAGKIDKRPGAPSASMYSLSVIVQSGRQAQLQQGNSLPRVVLATSGNPGSISYSNVGLLVNIIPTYASGSFKLLMGAESTELDPLRSTNNTVIKTNFTVALRVTVPGTNGLLLQCRDENNPNAQSYWLVAVPTALDVQGKPIKP